MVFLTLPEVAAQTREPEARLRRWCATGKLTCERDGRAWLVPATELPLVVLLGRRSGGSGGDRPLVGLALPGPTEARDLAEEVAALLGVATTTVVVRELAIDGDPYVVATWLDDPGPRAAGRLEELALARGGELLEAGPRRLISTRSPGPRAPQTEAASRPPALCDSAVRPGKVPARTP